MSRTTPTPAVSLPAVRRRAARIRLAEITTTDADRDVIAASWHEVRRLRPRDVTSKPTAHPVSLGDLAALAGHEITNPINGILNYARMLCDESTPGSLVHDIATRIIREGRRIANTVRDLRLLARTDASELLLVRDALLRSANGKGEQSGNGRATR